MNIPDIILFSVGAGGSAVIVTWLAIVAYQTRHEAHLNVRLLQRDSEDVPISSVDLGPYVNQIASQFGTHMSSEH